MSVKRRSTALLRTVIVLIGIGALAFLLWEPHVEGRNVNATLFQIYFNDPFLAYAYTASIPFFVALYHALKLAGQADVKRLRIIRHCAMAMIGFVAGGEVILLMNTSDDRAGGVFMGVLITFGSILIAFAAARFERILLSGSEAKPAAPDSYR